MTGNGGIFGTPGPGYFFDNKFGRNPDIDTAGVPEDVWPGGGLYPFLADVAVVEVLSDSVNDTAEGTGARTILFENLDGAWAEDSVIISLNGTTPVILPRGIIRNNRGKVLTAGSIGKNAGNITLRDSPGGTIRQIISFDTLALGLGQTTFGLRSIPAGKKAKIIRHWAKLDKFPGSTAQGRIVIREFGGAWQTKETFSIQEDTPHLTEYPKNTGIEVGEKSDIRMEIFSVVANDTFVDAGFDIEGEDL